jgi:hypothetical protein
MPKHQQFVTQNVVIARNEDGSPAMPKGGGGVRFNAVPGPKGRIVNPTEYVNQDVFAALGQPLELELRYEAKVRSDVDLLNPEASDEDKAAALALAEATLATSTPIEKVREIAAGAKKGRKRQTTKVAA